MQFIFFALALVVLSAALCASDSLIETRIVAKSGDADYYAFPSICRLQTGELLCVFYSGTGHVSPDGKIVMVRSTDEGRTWSQPRIIADTPIDDRDPSIMQTRSGRILINFFVYDGGPRDHAVRTTTKAHVCMSDDGGKTFGESEPIGIDWRWEATSDEILELPDSTLLLPIYGRREGDLKDRAAVAFSTDGGLTWNKRGPITIAYDYEGKMDFHEPGLVLLPSGDIRCALRTTGADYHAYDCRSTDGGRTWSEPVDTGIRGQASGLLYHSSGILFHAYRSFGDDGKVRGVGAVFGDPVKPWDPAKEFLLMEVGGDMAYPSSVELSDGSIYCVYYARDHRTIQAAVISQKAIATLK